MSFKVSRKIVNTPISNFCPLVIIPQEWGDKNIYYSS